MVFKFGLQFLFTNIGMGMEWTTLLIAVLATLPFFAKDFKVGIIALLTSMAGLFIWFYQAGYNYTLPLVVFFMSLIILVLSLFAVHSTSETGGFSG